MRMFEDRDFDKDLNSNRLYRAGTPSGDFEDAYMVKCIEHYDGVDMWRQHRKDKRRERRERKGYNS